MKKVSLDDDTYWKLLDLKVKMKCRTWRELVDKLHKGAKQSTSTSL